MKTEIGMEPKVNNEHGFENIDRAQFFLEKYQGWGNMKQNIGGG